VNGTYDGAYNWPGQQEGLYLAPDARIATIIGNRWIGNIVEGKADPSGLVYDRNRYYDPTAGRFTQQDPIGLAGGANLYGYAGGDPANSTDPFGLCPPCSASDMVALASDVAEKTKGLQSLEPAMLAVASLPTGGAAEGIGAEVTALGATLRAGSGSGILTAGSVAQEVASATGGTVSGLTKSDGFKVTVSGSRDVVARIKSTGAMRVAIDGIGALTRDGAISADKALTHLTGLPTKELISLVGVALQTMHVP
jgi:RHS repeat-associated protein